eukprot:TRINITY_DN60510_c0_g1_i1.p1 TRINITY_DN60510_c0_g1~~TRINITY_DN60510_c0_g1_i1.p1  ORF type:complete len:419 (+),score=58.41 TRINITY_DN60510_c0_g1_i1:53-1309(+)
MARTSQILRMFGWALGLASAAVVPLNATSGGETPFSALGCATSRPGDGGWIWQAVSGTMPSCNMPVRGDFAGMCVGNDGQPDHTSIFVNARSQQDRTGCFAWRTMGCSLDLRQVSRIEFDFDLTLCGGTWVAPLWLSPTPWENPAQFSGEIDFVENCPLGSLHTNFATGGVQMPIGSPQGMGGPKHMIMKLEDSSNVESPGTLTTQICDFGGLNCKDSAYYPNFLSVVESTKQKTQSDPYSFISDIWNGHGGDSGWQGCHAQNNPGTECTYAIRNIRVFTNHGLPMFAGACAAMNGNYGPSPPPPPPPAPAPQYGWVKHAGINCFEGHGGEVVPGDDPIRPFSKSMTVAQCEAACDSSQSCLGIVLPSNGSPQCWRRGKLDLSKCVNDPGYDLYERTKIAAAKHTAGQVSPSFNEVVV